MAARVHHLLQYIVLDVTRRMRKDLHRPLTAQRMIWTRIPGLAGRITDGHAQPDPAL